LRKAFIETNLAIHTRGQQNREFEGMGTTATAILLRPEGAWIGHVGDSRAYRVRDGMIEQLSFDHSLVWELARRQHKSPDELQGIPSNVIVRSLGPEPLVQVDIEGPHPVQPGDLFVLCSDGLSGQVSDREIGAVVSALPPADACRFLVHLANLQGGPDNITTLVVRVGSPGGNKGSANGRISGMAQLAGPTLSRRLGHAWPFMALFVGILLAMGAIALTYHDMPGRIPSFLLAAVALFAGLVGLMVQIAREKRQQAVAQPPTRQKVYRQAACAVDLPLVQRMDQAVGELVAQVREKNWWVDWDAYQGFRAEAAQHLERGNAVDAFRASCHALMVLMDAVQQQRGKEESFKPLWDKAPG
jgi:protein phosphatase